MRVMNENAMKADVDNMFDAAMAHLDKKIRDWFKGAWLKQMLKEEWFKATFIHKITVIDGSGLFRGMGGKTGAQFLSVRIKGRKTDIKEFTEWDAKDAKAGTLFWYEPTTHSLLHFNHMKEINMVRDYFKSLTQENPNVDLRRLNAQDAMRAAERWHADLARRQEQERRAAEARRQQELERLSEEQRKKVIEIEVQGLRDWKAMDEGRDYTYVDKDFTVSGERWTMIRLTSPKALTVESAQMAHCTYLYKDDIYDGKTVILSIRKKSELYNPVVTVEIHTNPLHIIQIQPFHNGRAHQDLGLPAVELPAGMKEAVERMVKLPEMQEKFKPLQRPGQFRVNQHNQNN